MSTHRPEQFTQTREYDTPIIVVSDGQTIRVSETTYEDILIAIRKWHAALYASAREAVSFESLQDRYRMCEAAITLIETDQSTGISLEAFGPVGNLVSRVVAYALGHDPEYTTVHWPVH